MTVEKSVGYLRIATEEAWSPPEMMQMYRDALAKKSVDDVGFNSMWGFYLGSGSERATQIIEKLQWLDERRIRDMDATGIDKQLLLLTSPGVQVFDTATATSLARSSNDQLAEAVRKHQGRFAGLAAVAPQDPARAAKEIERAVRQLGLKGVVLNSHLKGEYFDQPKYWDIFAAAEAHDAAVYIHPGTAPDNMIQPFLESGLDGAIFGFGVETGLHILRLIVSGLFDRFPKLRIVIGHMGEALPFWLYRLDYMYRATLNSKRYPQWRPNRKLPSDYLRENIFITTSGMAWEPAILFSQAVLGVDRVLYAMDYPYQFLAAEVQAHDDLQISAADKKRLFQTNAERVFGL
ncbi:MAG: amidohydrolase family protein [Steroidobacteraceae bacterium]